MAEEAERIKVWKKTKDARIKNRGGWYWARFVRNGVTIQESLKTQSFEIARRLTDEIESCLRLGVNWKKEHELFDTAWADFLADKDKGIKTRPARESTLKEYIKMGDRYFLPFFKDMRVEDINEEAWEKYVIWVKREAGAVTLFNHRKYLMGFLSWALRKGKRRNPVELYNPDPVDEEGPGKEYTDQELASLRTAEMPLKLAIYMAQYMGMRLSEITQLAKSRIDLDAKMITLRKQDTKTGQGRVVPIHPAVEPLLKAQISHTAGASYLFPNKADADRPMDKGGFKKPWGALKEKFEITGRFHDFKHTFITTSLRAGMNPVVLSKIVGTSIKVIERVYLHLKPKDLLSELKKLELVQIPYNCGIDDKNGGASV